MRWIFLQVIWLTVARLSVAYEPTRLPKNLLTLTRRAEVVGTFFIDTSERGICDSLNSQGSFSDADIAWSKLNMDQFIIDHVKVLRLEEGNDLSQFGGWTGAFFNLFAIGDTSLTIDCRTPDSNCDVPRKCDGYNDLRYAMASISIGNIHTILKARIKAYDNIINNNQERVRSLFTDLKFPETRGFRVEAFIQGFILGAEIALGGVTEAFTVAIRKAITKGFKEVIQSALPLDVNIQEDGRPVIDRLREARDSLTNILFSWNMRGVDDPALQFVSADETVAFFQQGAFVFPLPSEADLISSYEKDIETQMNAPLAASLWVSQDIKVGIFAESACSGGQLQTLHCNLGPGCSDLLFKATDFETPLCLELGNGDDLPPNLQGTLTSYGLNHQNIAKNAARCEMLGGAGKFPPDNTGDWDFGFPRCTFPLRRA
ncbi:hypothetical protein EDB81DRAFT_894500 [Dactylonectria macrodidyma]|uniref:Uncharacterized protein n=1 Tax=Dactylonectria macrodidyma TaxID=307937 RepID=A0A9P9I993_9HYPO|nr:hypothetical protein EDB81DRAFT_894500 [Dactylonectria macrodidyma]